MAKDTATKRPKASGKDLLTDTTIKNAKPKDKDYLIADGGGLYLNIKAIGTKVWTIRYTIDGKAKKTTFGNYPAVTLALARSKRDELVELISQGIDPVENKKAQKEAAKVQKEAETQKLENTFEKLFYWWIEQRKSDWVKSTYIKTKSTFENYFLPHIGHRQIDEITAKEYKELISKMSDKGIKAYAYKAKGMLSGFLRYLDERDIITAPTLIMTTILPKPKQTPFRSITDFKELGELLRALDDYQGDISTKYALKLAPYVFLRPANIRYAEWSEIDFEKAIWRIPADKMKMDSPHIVPLSSQALQILKEIRQFNGSYRYVFVSPVSKIKPLSENTLNMGLKRLGFGDRMVSHGFRHTASTILHENISMHGFHSEIIERQLAHAERNGVKAAYNHAEYLKERTELMQWWADFLDGLKNG